MNSKDRKRFDALVDEIVAALPSSIRAYFDEIPLIVDDHPSAKLLAELGMDPDEEILCGLHSGVPLSERSVLDSEHLPDVIHIFREGIVESAGGWNTGIDEDGMHIGGVGAIVREIRITILHELGHHFGLDENDLAQLGYE